MPLPARSACAPSPCSPPPTVLVVSLLPHQVQSREGAEGVRAHTRHFLTAVPLSLSLPHLVLDQEDQGPLYKGHSGLFHSQAIQVWA